MRMIQKGLVTGVLAAAGFWAIGCGGVSGHTYQIEGGGVSIEFESGGKATFVLGGMRQACTYVEDSKTVTVTCQGDKTVFTIQDDKLIPPNGSIIGPLTKK